MKVVAALSIAGIFGIPGLMPLEKIDSRSMSTPPGRRGGRPGYGTGRLIVSGMDSWRLLLALALLSRLVIGRDLVVGLVLARPAGVPVRAADLWSPATHR
jgi:hypothetical protein